MESEAGDSGPTPIEGPEELEEASEDLTAKADASVASTAAEQLVSEASVEVDEDAILADQLVTPDAAVPAHFLALVEVLEGLKYKPEIIRREEKGASQLRFDLPAGRSTRTVFVGESDAHAILADDLSVWSSLERFDGIWSSSEGTVEVALRSDRFGLPVSRILRHLASSHRDGEVDKGQSSIELDDDASGVSIQIGEASPLGAALLSSDRFSSRSPITLRAYPLALFTTAEADDIIERITDSLAVDLSINFGISLAPRRLETRSVARGFAVPRRGKAVFPRNVYPHAPVALYQAGRDQIASPLIRYWCYYQVLEYFFPSHSEAEAVRQLSRRLRSPAFDPHRDEDVLAAVQLAVAAGKGHGSEEEQLHTTLKAIVTPAEVTQFLHDRRLIDQMADKTSGLSLKTVNAKGSDDILHKLAQRIYDVRCKIVHSKSGSQRGAGPGLLPGTQHDDLVRHELRLMEYLAQQALLTSADRLTLARQ